MVFGGWEGGKGEGGGGGVASCVVSIVYYCLVTEQKGEENLELGA